MSLLFVILGIFILNAPFTEGLPYYPCPYGWIGRTWDTYCYQFNDQVTSQDWLSARDVCRRQNGDLVSITNLGQFLWIKAQVDAISQVTKEPYWWIGLVTYNRSTWTWSDNETVNRQIIPAQWDIGYPINGAIKNVTAMRSDTGKLRNIQQTKNYAFICKRKSDVPVACNHQDGWEHHDNHCYKVTNGTKRTWSDARSSCQLEEADLVVVSDETIDKTVMNLVKRGREKKYWIGLRTVSESSLFSWQWVNETRLLYTAWYGEGNTSPKDGNCIASRIAGRPGNSWQAYSCSEEYSYICQKPEGQCAEGWYQFHETCYLPSVEKKTWNQANEFCTQAGANLVNIKTSKVQTFIEKNLVSDFEEQNTNHVWIGIRQDNSRASLDWTQGGRVNKTFTKWAPSEPSKPSDGTASCGQLYAKSGSAIGLWSIPLSCLRENGFICEIPLHKQPKGITPPTQSYTCEDGWNLWNIHCYRYVDAAVDWQTASQACQQSNAQLVDIQEEREQEFLQGHVTYNAWCGLNSRTRSGIWTWSLGDSRVTYEHWDSEEPDNSRPLCAFVMGSSMAEKLGFWKSANCSNLNSYVCKKGASVTRPTSPPVSPPPEKPDWSQLCGPLWKYRSGSSSCYRISPGPTTQEMADRECRKDGGSLVRIGDQSDQDYVNGLIKNSTGVRATSYWIGLNRLSRFQYWEWTSGPVSYINWAEKEPVLGYMNKCAKILPAIQTWGSAECVDRHGYICQKTVVDTSTPPPTPPGTILPPGVTRGCPDGWQFYEGRCFRAFSTKASWSDAEKDCVRETLGGHLASMSSEDEALALSLLVSHGLKDPKRYWIGMRARNMSARGREFYWTDSSEILFTDWTKWQPTKSGDCVIMDVVSRQWAAVPTCDNELPYFCSQPSIIVPETTPPPPTPGCPTGYLGNGFSCYKVFIPNGAYAAGSIRQGDAEKRCVQQGGHLVDVTDFEEQTFLQSALGSMNIKDIPLWIGLIRESYVWQWLSGARVSFYNWAPTRNDYSANCAVMLTDHYKFGKWDSYTCEDSRVTGYICKVPNSNRPTLPPPPTTTVDPRTCDLGSDWKEVAGRCYAAYGHWSGQHKTWDDANSFCNTQGATLATIPNAEVNMGLKAIFPYYTQDRKYWIGLNSKDTKGFRWTDGSLTTYFNWSGGVPDNHNEIQDCTQYSPKNQSWTLENCAVIRGYICGASKGATRPLTALPTVPTARPEGRPCGDDIAWNPVGEQCIKIFKYYHNTKGWMPARQACMDEGGDLVSIHSKELNDYILTQINTNSGGFWIGLNELGFEDGFKWTDRSPVDFTNWGRNQPDDSQGFEHCVTISPHDGFWYDHHCDENFPFICKRPKKTYRPKTDPPATPLPGNCPLGFTAAGNKCFKVYTQPQLNWTSAEKYCEDLNFPRAYLASVADEFENALMIVLTKDAPGNLWIGASRHSSKFRYLWRDNSPMNYINWNRGEPAWASADTCVLFHAGKGTEYMTGKWMSRKCSEKAAFVCMTYKVASISTPSPSMTPNPCPEGFSHFGVGCYMFTNSLVTWEQARRLCASHGTSMVSVHDVFEQSFVHSLSASRSLDNVWFGLSDEKDEGTFTWQDGWPVTYTHWGTSQPRMDPAKKCGVIQKNGTWALETCSNLKPFLCANKTGPPPTVPPQEEGSCPSDWIAHGRHCYLLKLGVSNQEKESFATSDLRCQRYGAHLVSFSSKKELDLVMDDMRHALRGVFNNAATAVWTGLFLKLDGTFAWTDETAVDFLFFDSGEPKISPYGQSCVTLWVGTGRWRVQPCSQYLGHICKKEKASLTGVSTDASKQTRTAGPNLANKLSSSRHNNGLIAFGVILAIVIICALGLSVLFILRRKRDNGGGRAAGSSGGFDNVFFERSANQVALGQNAGEDSSTA